LLIDRRENRPENERFSPPCGRLPGQPAAPDRRTLSHNVNEQRRNLGVSRIEARVRLE
jgi:hypothetical protein